MLGPSAEANSPLLLVDLDKPASPAEVVAAAGAVSAGDVILIGVTTRRVGDTSLTPLLSALDLTLTPSADTAPREVVPTADPFAEAEELAAVVAANPHATTMLAGLLRWSGALAVPAALDAESLAYSTLLGGPEFRRWLADRGPRPLPPPAPAEPVLMERDGDLLHITLNRPERRNAYGREVRDALVEALEFAELDPTLERVTLDGAGPSFCSGGDLDEFGTTPDLVTAHWIRTRAGAARPLHRLAGRVEARVHGTCVGAGIELPAFAGHVTATPHTTFRLPEIGMGLVPGAGGTVSIPRRIGRWRTLHLALTGRALDAPTALAWGLIDQLT
ncbi:enoyl-CoA hydratase/isomerase family protein [Streptomyces gilvus]|uniref:enoyl-CoA hydratase/isomerase family protein n=1 Tax=Streptomyces gilvus TaxID=2920937 RepID=UPI001F103F59|nr:enoyl-CoA hydratase/isomerase family protein [Streptomyces sp. CME 23]MCH5675604.1 enoyl-CoA hydratase/isomerase family protein [Streptomyces sp. CME 23]